MCSEHSVTIWKRYSTRTILSVLLLIVAGNSQAGETVYYHGPISAGANAEFFKRVAGRPVERLVIDSSGGEVVAGIALGRWVYENKLDVGVDGYCLSSCANYVFPAGRKKTILPGAVVAWHGNYHHLEATGLWRDDVRTRVQRDGENEATATAAVRRQVKKLVALEKQFFDRIGVDEFVCWVGKLPPYNVPAYYFLSVQDMAHFGIREVTAAPGYPQTDLSPFQQNIQFLRLQAPDEAG
jgi:hypothetical protein